MSKKKSDFDEGLYEPPRPKISLLMFETQLWNVLSVKISTVGKEEILGYGGATLTKS